MKKVVLNIAVIFAVSVLASCGSQSNDSKEEVSTVIVEEKVEVKKTEDHHESVSGLSLNNGQRWEANLETTEGVHNMVEIMDSFLNRDDVASYKILTKDLKVEFSMIFKKCTMTGDAHNQLHHFLIPIKDSFKGLSSDDLNTCKETFTELTSHLATYDSYFE